MVRISSGRIGFVAGMIMTGSLVSAPIAQADSVAGHAAPAGKGVVRVTTAPGGYIDVQVIGRIDTTASSGPAGGGCWVFLGDRVRENFLAVDQLTGSGATRFGPLENGTYAIGGVCGDRRDLRAVSDLLAPKNIAVTIDTSTATGQGNIQPPSAQVPKPMPTKEGTDFNADCAGADVFNTINEQIPPLPGGSKVGDLLNRVGDAAAIANIACMLNIAAYHGGPNNPEFTLHLCYLQQYALDRALPEFDWSYYHRLAPDTIPESPTDLRCGV